MDFITLPISRTMDIFILLIKIIITHFSHTCIINNNNNKMADNAVQAAIEKTLIDASKVIEDQLDQEIERLDKMDEDEMEKLRQNRLQQVRNNRHCMHNHTLFVF